MFNCVEYSTQSRIKKKCNSVILNSNGIINLSKWRSCINYYVHNYAKLTIKQTSILGNCIFYDGQLTSPFIF